MKLEDGLLNRLTDLTNRSKGQTQFLFELCDFDFEKLLELERKLHNNFVFWVPGDKESRDIVLKMDYGSGWWDKMYGVLDWKKCKPMLRLKQSEKTTDEKENQDDFNNSVNEIIKKFKNKKGFENRLDVLKQQLIGQDMPQLIGYRSNELSLNRCHFCSHLKYPKQLGINWDKHSLSKWIQSKGGMPNYWMDETLFEFARPFIENDGTLLWDWNYERNKSLPQIKKEEDEAYEKFQKKLKKLKEND